MRHGNYRAIWLTLAVASLSVLTLEGSKAQSDTFPSKTMRIVVGFAAGGGNDLIARIVAEKLQSALGQTVVVENKVGAGGRLAAEFLMTQPPDGHTLMLGASGAMAITPAITEKLPYATLRDFVPVSQVAAFPLVMITGMNHPAKTVKEYVEWAKANPDKSNYGTTSPAFTLAVELFKLKSGAPITAIPYKSGNEMVVSVMAGDSSVTVVDPPPAAPQIAAGKLRGLAVMATNRSEDMPDVPTIGEAGYPDVLVSLWSGIFAPKGTPEPVVRKLESEIRRIMQLPDVKQKFRTMATNTAGSTSQEFSTLIAKETEMWRGVAQAANLKFD
jgi:tripartite-type tricarboxylate transporter receptor subunit TctC